MSVLNRVFTRLRAGHALGALAIIAALCVLAAANAGTAKAVIGGGGGGGSDSCTMENDWFDNYATEGRVGIQMHLKCSSSGALIKGTIACIQEYVAGYGGTYSWRLGECWSGTFYGVAVLGGFQNCNALSNGGSIPMRGEVSWNVTFPDGYQITYSGFTRQAGEPCTLGN